MTVPKFSKSSVVSYAFGIDYRSLALFRVALALVLLSDLFTKASSLRAFYTDEGILPRVAQLEIYANSPWLFCINHISGLFWVQVGLMLLSFASAFSLLVGYRTRIATFLSWLLLMSLHNRNPMVLQGGDVLMRQFLFWSLFLPLGGFAALDQYRKTFTKPTAPILSVGTLAILLQVAFLYLFAAALKTDVSWVRDGTALYYALSIDQLVKPFGSALLRYPDILGHLSFTALYIERYGPYLAFLPFWRFRVWMVMVFIGFHFLMGMSLTLGIFPVIAMAGWLLFLPTQFWDFLEKLYLSKPLHKLRARVETLYAKAALSLENAHKLWVSTFVGTGRGEALEDDAKPPVSQNWHRKLSGFQQGNCLFFLLYVFGWNLRSVDATYEQIIPNSWNWIGELTRCDQKWDMFAPGPLRADGWYIADAKLADGTEVDLLRQGAPVDWKKPANLSSTYPDAQWQKYMLNLWVPGNTKHLPLYTGYLANQWNPQHLPQQHVRSIHLYYMREDTLLDNKTKPVEKVAIWIRNF